MMYFRVSLKINEEWVTKRSKFSDEDDAYAFCVGSMKINKDVKDFKILVNEPVKTHQSEGYIYRLIDYGPKITLPYMEEMQGKCALFPEDESNLNG